MPVSLADFATKVAAQVAASGAIFRTVGNPDGSLQVLRAPSSTSGVWSVLFPRVVYNQPADTVLIGDGSIMTASSAQVFINGLA
jgi:hypothetical protein